MWLEHATRRENLRDIIREGIKCSRETLRQPEWDYVSNPDYIYFSARKYSDPSAWGDYSIYINPDWLVRNSGQFRAHYEKESVEAWEMEFRSWLDNLGIENSSEMKKDWKDTDMTFRTVISLKPIPLEGLGMVVCEKPELIPADLDFGKIKIGRFTKEGIEIVRDSPNGHFGDSYPVCSYS